MCLVLFAVVGCSTSCKVRAKAKGVMEQQNMVIHSILKVRSKKEIAGEIQKNKRLSLSEAVLEEGLESIVESNEKLIGGLK